jgi:hypothetical protein
VYKTVDRGANGTEDKPVGDGYIHGRESARRKAEKNRCFWIEPIAGAFDGAGEYELQLQVDGSGG